MKQQLGQLTLLVRDYDEAIHYYTKVLGFELLEDTKMSETKRWVRVSPQGSTCHLLLAKAANESQQAQIGLQAGGRVFLFLYTDDFWRDYKKYTDPLALEVLNTIKKNLDPKGIMNPGKLFS